MLLVPLPFVVALFLMVLLARLLRARGEEPPNLPFVALITGCAVQSVLMGLRWGYGIESVRFAQPVVAAALPALLSASFGRLVWTTRRGIHIWSPALPSLLVAGLLVLRPAAVDAALIVIYLGYAAALLWLARPGPDGLRRAPLDGVLPTWRALQAAALVLIASATVDMLVVLNLEWGDGRLAGTIVGVANLAGLLVLGLAASVAGRVSPPAEPHEGGAPPTAVEDNDLVAVAETIDRLMAEQELFRDAALNINRLARRAGIPARRVSVALNRVRQQNVSQYVNGHRIADACRLLENTERPVTHVMLDVGFGTKSNFNREFRRVTGMSPAEWRQTAREGQHRTT